MTKRLRKASIVQRLNERLGLEDVPGSVGQPFLLERRLVLVTDIADLLREGKYERKSGTGIATGVEVARHTVPAGKRWHLINIRIARTSGDRELEVLRVVPPGSSVDPVYLSQTGASTLVKEFTARPRVEAGGYVFGETGAGGATNSNFTSDLLYEEEDAY